MTQKMTVTPYVNLTDRMSGTECSWPWEVLAVYVNGSAEAFTWSDGVLDIPGYTSGVVLADFTLYLIYDEPSSYQPSDPTDPGSAMVFWESRLSNFFAVSTTIKSFETGLTEVSGGSITILIDDDWIDLITEIVIFSNRTIRIYTDDVISFKGITTKFDINGFQMTVQIQKRQTILEAECTWGDPVYLNKIDRSNNDAYYNGANIPSDFEGYAIPMLFGDSTPYESGDGGEVDLGTPAPTFLTPPGTKRPSIGISTSSVIVRVIPTGTGSGILGRMPSYQSISSVPINEALTSPQHVFGRAERGSNAVIFAKMIKGEVCTLERTTGPDPIINSARYYAEETGPRGLFNLGSDDTVFTNYDVLKDCDENIHFFPAAIPNTNWTTGATLSGTFTPGGHRWLTVSGLTGVDLANDEMYMVITSVSGARTAMEVMKFALEAHGYTVNAASFTSLATALPYKTMQQAGNRNTVPTLGTFISEINRSLMTILVFPASNDEPFVIKIDPTQSASNTIYESQISGLKVSHEYRDQAKAVEFSPRYARSDAQKTALFARHDASMATLFQSERTLQLAHVLTEVPGTRWEEITDVYGSPTTVVSFTLLDDTVSIELADCVQIEHPSFSKKILITQITTQPLGRNVQGRYLYVNNS